MRTQEKLRELLSLQTKVNELRRELSISAPREVTYLAELAPASGQRIVVEADGFGGATVSVIHGNYPVDYSTQFEKFFPTERAAEAAANELASHKRTPAQLLTGA